MTNWKSKTIKVSKKWANVVVILIILTLISFLLKFKFVASWLAGLIDPGKRDQTTENIMEFADILFAGSIMTIAVMAALALSAIPVVNVVVWGLAIVAGIYFVIEWKDFKSNVSSS